MVGSAIIRQLSQLSDAEIVYRDRSELNLTDQSAVRHFFHSERVDQVYLAAARVGGILCTGQKIWRSELARV